MKRGRVNSPHYHPQSHHPIGGERMEVEFEAKFEVPEELKQWFINYIIPKHERDIQETKQKLINFFKERGYDDSEIRVHIEVEIRDLRENAMDYVTYVVAKTQHGTDSDIVHYRTTATFVSIYNTKQMNEDGEKVKKAVEPIILRNRIRELEKELENLRNENRELRARLQELEENEDYDC